jgi:hypothetical protein
MSRKKYSILYAINIEQNKGLTAEITGLSKTNENLNGIQSGIRGGVN